MDGFFSKGTSATSGVKTAATKARQGVSPIVNTSAKTVHRGAQRSKTLMRSAVVKPAQKRSKAALAAPAGKSHASKVNLPRAFRAKETRKNSKVSRFSPFTARQASQPAAAVATDVATQQVISASPAVSPGAQQVLPSMVTSASHHQLERLLDQALHRADAHKKAVRGKMPGRSWWQRIFDAPRWLSIGSAVLAVAILAGFFAWQNIPQVSMHLAANQSKVNASLPAYTPPGFSFAGPIKYTDKSVTLDYSANSDAARKFKIIQESSNETSSSLAANSLANDPSVQTSQVNGSTVYVYSDQNHATWVNHGVRYTIQDNAKLDTEQILKIAGSLQ